MPVIGEVSMSNNISLNSMSFVRNRLAIGFSFLLSTWIFIVGSSRLMAGCSMMFCSYLAITESERVVSWLSSLS